MVKFVSPGIYAIESDTSEYTPNISSSRIGIVGTASRGPTNELKLITSQNSLIRTFGPPSEELYGQGLEGALEILEQANQVYYIRAADSSVTDASATMQLGACPAVAVSGSPGGVVGDAFGIGRSLYLEVQATDNDGTYIFTTPKRFEIPAGTLAGTNSSDSQAKALRKVIGGDILSDKIGIAFDATNEASGIIYSRYAGSGATLYVSSYSDNTYTSAAGGTMGCLVPHNAIGASSTGIAPLTGSVARQASWQARSFGTSFEVSGASGLCYNAVSIHPGGGYNASTDTVGNSIGITCEAEARGNGNTVISFNDAGVQRESFNVALYNSGTFVEDVINTGETNATSEIVKGNIFVSGTDFTPNKPQQFMSKILEGMGISTHELEATTKVNPNGFNASSKGTGPSTDPITLINGGASVAWGSPKDVHLVTFIEKTTSMTGGGNGGTDTAALHTALIGDASLDPKTGMQALDDESASVDIALCPGIFDHTVRTNLIALAEATQNFLALFSPPYGIGTPGDAIDWTNGRSSTTLGESTTPFNSSYAAVYYPHLKVYDKHTASDRWFDPAIFAARQMAFTDREDDPWFAPAGAKRGILYKPSEVEVKLNQGDRDALYSGGNVINPIVNFANQGITIFGQRTTQRKSSSLDRINVRRLMIAVRKAIINSCRQFVFEPNDVFTYERIEGVLNPFLDEIRRRRGLTEFRVVCDDTVNTPERVERNELFCKVLIKPTKTAEVLVFEVNLTNQSAQLGTAVD